MREAHLSTTPPKFFVRRSRKSKKSTLVESL
jgi:hypothetical protein